LAEQGSELPLIEFLGAANRFLDPSINRQLFLVRKLQQLKPLILGGLLVG
jgi:hypothetical protein